MNSSGIDSSYLMIHEWQRVTKEIRDGEKKGGTVGHRMSEIGFFFLNKPY